MRTLEKEGKTIDEAIWKGLQELDLPRESVRIEILDEGSKGLFGIGGRPAKVLLMELEIVEELDIKGFMRSSDVAPRGRGASRSQTQSRAPSQRAPQNDTRGTTPGGRSSSRGTAQSMDQSSQDRPAPKSKRYDFDQVQDPVLSPQDDIARKIAQQLKERSQSSISQRSQPREPRASDRDRGGSYQTSSVPIPEHLEVPSEGAGAQLYTFLSSLFGAMQLQVALSVQETDNMLQASIYGDGQDLGLLIGKHGATLDSLQYVCSLALNRNTTDRIRIQIQIGDYRQRRAETLSRLAERTAAKVMRDGYPQSLEPMPANERRLIHMTLQEHDHVETVSEGEDPRRYVVVRLKVIKG